MGRVGVGVKVRGLGSKVVFFVFIYFPSHNTESTSGPNQIPRFPYFILYNNPERR